MLVREIVLLLYLYYREFAMQVLCRGRIVPRISEAWTLGLLVTSTVGTAFANRRPL